MTVDGAALLGEPRLRPIASALAAGRTARARCAVRDGETGAGAGAGIDTVADPLTAAVLDGAVARLEVSASMATLLGPADVVAAAGRLPLARGPMFSFPAGSLAALEVLAAAGRSGRVLPPATRALADSFISSAVVNGTPHERRQAVTVLGAASDDLGCGASPALRPGAAQEGRGDADGRTPRAVRSRVRGGEMAGVWGALSPSDDDDICQFRCG